MAKGFGIAALIVALLTIVMPYGVNFFGVGLACALAVVAALAGDRVFATATPVISAVSLFFLSPMTAAVLFYGGDAGSSVLLVVALAFLAAPFGAMFLNATGKLALQTPDGRGQVGR